MAMASSASVAVGGRGRGGRIRALTKSRNGFNLEMEVLKDRSTNGIAKIPKKATIPALKGTEGNNSESQGAACARGSSVTGSSFCLCIRYYFFLALS
ncbi:unnamed protein product [Prunus armeniaca]|uniref:Uncharacterized protein n=1 Tax=Prunus armeniaca TaxID=36596 RepID=A0A6J5VB10_PRUAR|nr:unnamed protein product [Prunus armeniaca]